MTTETTMQTEVSSLEYLMQNYAQYNLWANATLIHWLKTKSTEQVEKEVLSSFPSIKLTLLHILKTQSYWLSVISQKAPTDDYSEEISIDNLYRELIDQSASVSEFIEGMSAYAIQDETLITNPWFECNFQNFEYIMQCVNHSTYHRGQITTIGRQLGFTDAPNTDYNFYNVRGK